MAVALLDRNYNTNYCVFSYDNWENDKDFLPTLNTSGKGVLADIYSVIQGSYALGTDGSKRILNGDKNEWIEIKNTNGTGTNTDYILPIANKTRLGGVMIGDNINITNDGTISVDTDGIIDKSIATENDVDEMLDIIFGNTESN